MPTMREGAKPDPGGHGRRLLLARTSQSVPFTAGNGPADGGEQCRQPDAPARTAENDRTHGTGQPDAPRAAQFWPGSCDARPSGCGHKRDAHRRLTGEEPQPYAVTTGCNRTGALQRFGDSGQPPRNETTGAPRPGT